MKTNLDGSPLYVPPVQKPKMPLMRCGHRANGIHVVHDGGEQIEAFVCLRCLGIISGAGEIVSEPLTAEMLAGRVAICKICGQTCMSETLPPMFEHCPDKEADKYICPACLED